MNKVSILHGDALTRLRDAPDESVHCCVTSPPYYGLRDYGVEGQIGLEPTPDAYVGRLVEVFREVRRVLRRDGTLWLNIGDSYAAARKGSGGTARGTIAGGRGQSTNAGPFYSAKFDLGSSHLKPKDLIGIPWMLAFALRADGWYLRQDIIWHKPNPMPESVRDRCTKAHEYIFLMSKSAKYYFDPVENKVPYAASTLKEFEKAYTGTATKDYLSAGAQDPSAVKARIVKNHRGGGQGTGSTAFGGGGANRRSVWTVTTKPHKGAHFATFPPDLILPCVRAGCPPDGVILDPFGGSGTVGQVAVENGRNAILIDLNPDYCEMARGRVGKATPKCA